MGRRRARDHDVNVTANVNGSVNRTDVTDVQSYAETLDERRIGKTITIRIRRDNEEVALQVLVGPRSH